MISNVGANNASNIMNEMKKSENMAVEKEQMKEQSRIEELKQQIQNDQYKIDLRATATKMAQELKPE
ncbi:MAG: flagellar biosynthesis anti-sigma factor FlgM [Hydrogenimonas sp.]|nr:flagellar biosynthesis anti-sigma factor FlgM [Hydrogenimonas sp.]